MKVPALLVLALTGDATEAATDASESQLRSDITKGAGSQSDITKLANDITFLASDASKEAMETELQITTEANQQSNEPRQKINALKYDIDNSISKVSNWEQTQSQLATQIAADAGAKKSRMMQDHNAATSAGTALEQVIEDTERTTNDAQEEQVTSDGQAIFSQLEENKQNVMDSKTSFGEEYGAVKEAITEGYTGLAGAAGTAKDEAEEAHDSQVEAAEELEGNIVAAKRDFKNTIKDLKSDQRAAKHSIDDAGAEIRNAAASATKEIASGVTERKNEFIDWQRDMDGDIKSGIRELQQEMKDSRRDFRSDLKDIFSDGVVEQKDIDADETADVVSSDETKQAALRVMETVTDEGVALSDTMNSYQDNAKKRLDMQEDQIHDSISQMQGELEGSQEEFESQVTRSIVEAKGATSTLGGELAGAAATEIGDSVEAERANMQSASSELEQLAGTIDSGATGVTAASNAAIFQMQATTTSVEAAVQRTQVLAEQVERDGKAAADAVKKASDDSVSDVDGEIAEKLKEIKEDTDNKEGSLTQGVADAKAALEGQITELRTVSAAARGAANTAINHQALIAGDVLGKIEAATELVQQNKGKVEQLLPVAKDSAMKTIGEVQATKEGVKQAVQDATLALNHKIESLFDGGKVQVNMENQKVSAELHTATQAYEANVDSQLNSAEVAAEALTLKAEEDQRQAEMFKAKMQNQIEASQEFLHDEASESSDIVTNLDDAAESLKNRMTTDIRLVKTKGEKMGDDLTKEIRSQATQAEALATSQKTSTLKTAGDAMVIDATHNAEQLKKVEDTVKVYLGKKDLMVKNLDDKKKLLETDFDNYAQKAAAIDQKLQADMTGLENKEQSVAAASESQVSEEQAIIDAARNSLSNDIKTNSHALMTNSQANNDQLKSQEEAKLQQAETGAGQETSQVEGETEQIKSKFDAWVAENRIAMKDSEHLLDAFEKHVADAKTTMNGDAAGLEQMQVTWQDKLETARRQFEQQQGEVMKTSTDVAEQEAGALGQKMAEAKVELGVLHNEFEDQTTILTNTAKKQIAKIGQELEALLESSPNLSADFIEATKETTTNLGLISGRIEESKGKTTTLIGQMELQLTGVREAREKQAAEIHGISSTMKTTAADKAEEALTTIRTMIEDSKVAQDGMLNELRTFRNTMASSSLETNHDQSKIETMDGLKLDLTKTHEQLMHWMDHNRHRTHAWRHEATKKLGNMMSSMNIDADTIKNAQVTEEMGMNKDLRGMQMDMENKVADKSVLESKHFSSMIDGTLRQMNELLGAEAISEARKERMSKDASSAMERDNDRQDAALSEVDAENHGLEDAYEANSVNTKNAMAEIQNQLILPKMTASDVNQAADRKLSTVTAAMNWLRGGGVQSSMLQTSTEGSQAQVEDAVTRLNDELTRENAKMRAENMQLKESLRKVKQQYGLV